MRTVALNKFDGGMVNDPRDPSSNAARIVQHFDAFTNPYKLTPYRSSENGDTGSVSNTISNFLYYQGTFYGMGTVNISGTNIPQIFYKASLTDGVWTPLTPWGTIHTGLTPQDAETHVFVAYHGKLYGVNQGRYIWSYTIDTVSTPTEADLTAYTNTAQGMVHSKTDLLFIPYDNKIAKYDGSTWTTAALTLPTDFIITSICEYGNYLAIAARPNTGLRSKVFLWDMNSTAVNVSENIDWGEGNLMVLEELEGSLIGVSFVGTNRSNNLFTRAVFRYYNGASGAIKFQELLASNLTTYPIIGTVFKQKFNNRIFFSACIPIVSTSYLGIWSIGRSSSGVPFAVTFDRLIANGTTLVSPNIYGFYVLGDYLFASYTANLVWAMDKTDHSAHYTSTSAYETTINPGMPEHIRGSAGERSSQKTLKAVALGTEPLTTGQQAVLKYRVEGGAWHTALTANTIGKAVHEAAPVFASGREYEFRVESTGGAEITELKYRYEKDDTLL